MSRQVPWAVTLLAAGLLAAAAYAASPLSVWVLVVALVAARALGRNLPADERRMFYGLFAAAFAARVLFVCARFLAATPDLNDLSIGGLGGDEAYYLSRAIRSRDILLGFSHGTYDYFVTTDEYGRTSYLRLLTWFQVAFGPTPYSMRLVNVLFFLTGASLLYRTMRAVGPVAALWAFGVLLFVPSLFVSSTSLLKESLYFMVASALFCSIVQACRATRFWPRLWFILVAFASLWLLDDLRRGAVMLAVAGFAAGLAIRVVFQARWRVAVALIAITVAGAGALSQSRIRARVVDGVESAARAHAGHVFTVGHAYKLMDESFYVVPQTASDWDLTLTEAQAARFVLRAAASFLLTPLPWDMRSRSELAFLPEHMLWYVILALLPAGVVAGWKRDPLTTSLLLGYALPTAAVLALTNGNVGTLLRLRGLVTPYLLWLSVLGFVSFVTARSRGRSTLTHPIAALPLKERGI
jgi:hypothetical protein